MLTALSLQRELRTGSSLPLLVEASDRHVYVVKPHGSGDGVVASIVEWIALELGARLDLPVAKPYAIRLNPGFETQAKDPEVRELIERSHGVNFATAWIGGAKPLDSETLDDLDPEVRSSLFLFDLFLLNIDRHANNLNAVFGPRGLLCMDFASSVSIRQCLMGRRAEERADYLRQLRRNPFFQAQIDPEPFIERLRSVAGGMPFTIPSEWEESLAGALGSKLQVDGLGQRMWALLDQAQVLRSRLRVLEGIPLETDADRRQRADENKAEFIRRFGPL
ncbi:MAG: HipA family kinase [Acidobacteriota bacterium]